MVVRPMRSARAAADRLPVQEVIALQITSASISSNLRTCPSAVKIGRALAASFITCSVFDGDGMIGACYVVRARATRSKPVARAKYSSGGICFMQERSLLLTVRALQPPYDARHRTVLGHTIGDGTMAGSKREPTCRFRRSDIEKIQCGKVLGDCRSPYAEASPANLRMC